MLYPDQSKSSTNKVELILNVIGLIMRWIHIISSCCLIGAFYYVYNFTVPGTEMQQAKSKVLRNCHYFLTLLLISGLYNSFILWKKRNQLTDFSKKVWIGLLHIKVILGISCFFILVPRSQYQSFHIFIFLCCIACSGSILRFLRETFQKFTSF
eukprot:TRINITY_DN183_c3_g1_i1.p1 TRINITY_DN183_c3_g1~~TRINITY_DN183_c3_g1_i1.p1  ORF type:complete len:154 (+),score=40.20 TRINITY_DN183_c3_g1_i1:103-564(+)